MFLTGRLCVVLTKGISGRREELSLFLRIRKEGEMSSRSPYARKKTIEHEAKNRAMVIVQD